MDCIGLDRLSQTRPIPRSPDGDNNNNEVLFFSGLKGGLAAKLSSGNNDDLRKEPLSQ